MVEIEYTENLYDGMTESEIKWLKNAYENCKDNLFQQYLDEVASFEKYGSTNVISYGEWLKIKNKD